METDYQYFTGCYINKAALAKAYISYCCAHCAVVFKSQRKIDGVCRVVLRKNWS